MSNAEIMKKEPVPRGTGSLALHVLSFVPFDYRSRPDVLPLPAAPRPNARQLRRQSPAVPRIAERRNHAPGGKIGEGVGVAPVVSRPGFIPSEDAKGAGNPAGYLRLRAVLQASMEPAPPPDQGEREPGLHPCPQIGVQGRSRPRSDRGEAFRLCGLFHLADCAAFARTLNCATFTAFPP